MRMLIVLFPQTLTFLATLKVVVRENKSVVLEYNVRTNYKKDVIYILNVIKVYMISSL